MPAREAAGRPVEHAGEERLLPGVEGRPLLLHRGPEAHVGAAQLGLLQPPALPQGGQCK